MTPASHQFRNLYLAIFRISILGTPHTVPSRPPWDSPFRNFFDRQLASVVGPSPAIETSNRVPSLLHDGREKFPRCTGPSSSVLVPHWNSHSYQQRRRTATCRAMMASIRRAYPLTGRTGASRWSPARPTPWGCLEGRCHGRDTLFLLFITQRGKFTLCQFLVYWTVRQSLLEKLSLPRVTWIKWLSSSSIPSLGVKISSSSLGLLLDKNLVVFWDFCWKNVIVMFVCVSFWVFLAVGDSMNFILITSMVKVNTRQATNFF